MAICLTSFPLASPSGLLRRLQRGSRRSLLLITRGMTTQPHAQKTSRIVSFLMVFGIRAQLKNGRFQGAISYGFALPTFSLSWFFWCGSYHGRVGLKSVLAISNHHLSGFYS